MHGGVEAVDDVLLDLGGPDPDAFQELRDAGVLTRGVHHELGRHHIQFVVAVHRDTDDGVATTVVDEVTHLRLVAELDARFVVQPAPHAPLEQRTPGTDDLNIAGAGLLPGAAQSNAVLVRHVDLERALTHHVVDDAGEDALQLDLTGGQQVVQMPALCRTRPALPARVTTVLFEDDHPLERLTQHLGRGDPRDAAADDNRGAAAASSHIRQVELRVVQAGRGASAHRPTGYELLVVEADAVNTVVVQPTSGRLDHRRRAAEVDIGVAAIQHSLVQQIGDEPDRAIPVRRRLGHDDLRLQAWDALRELVEFVELAQVLGGGHAVQQVDRLPDVGVEAMGHRQDRRQAGAARHQDHGPHHGSQVEAALAAPQCYAVTRFRPVAQIVRHHTVGQQPDDELQFGATVGGMRVGVVAPRVGAGNL